MTLNSLRLACLSICLQASFAQSQTQDAEAASRAQRDADNPLRMILEASKLKPRQKPADPEVAAKAAPEKITVRTPVTKQAVPGAATLLALPQLAPAALPVQSPPVGLVSAVETARPAVAPLVQPVPSAVIPAAAPQGLPPGLPESPAAVPTAPTVEPTLASSLPTTANPTVDASPPDIASTSTASTPSATAATNAAVLAPNADARPAAEQPAATQLAWATPVPPRAEPVNPAAPAVAARGQLQLADYVEPVVPDRLRRRLQGEAVVVVKFTVNSDGSVADAAVRSSSDRALDPIALGAVSQWRYKPIAAAQPHAVELVFKTAN